MTRRFVPGSRATLLGLAVLISGCAKRVPVPDGAFDSQQKVVLAFAGGKSVSGQIDTNARVRFEDQGKVYRARVRALSDSTIVLEHLVLVQEGDALDEVTARLADSRVSIGPVLPEVTLTRTDIQNVERMQFDGPRTLRNGTFWAFSAAVVAMLLGERS
jgi:hypothetical protein